MSTVRIQVRRGTAAQWTSVNPILAAGELGVESDTNLFKFGNGSSTWTALSYANNSDVAIGEISQDAINTALTVGSGLTKTYNDGANTITIAVDASYFNELAQDALNTAFTSGTGITKTYDDSANTITVAVDTTVIADRSWVSGQVTNLSNTVTDGFLEVGDRGAASGVASLDSNSLVPQAQILEPVQDIVAAMTTGGRGLNTSYNDTTGALTLTPAISGRNGVLVEDVAGNGIGLYLDNTITAHTKLTTPLVEAGTVSASTVTTGDITVSGNLTVNGTTTTVNSTTVSFDDPMIYMGDGNQSNALDLGFVAAFNNGTYQHSGLVRDASENKWVLFSGVVAEPTTTVDFSTYTKDGLVVGALNATSATIGNVSNSEIQHLGGVTSAIQTQLNSITSAATSAATSTQTALDLKLASATAANTYAPIASPAFTGTVTGVTKSMVGLGNAEDTADSAKPISTATQTALDLKLASATAATTYAALSGASFTGTVTGITKSMVGLANVDNTTDAGKPVSSAAQTALDLKANIASPTFTGTVTGVSKSMVGLGDVDNTADSAKPISTATQTALDLKAPLASPTFTGTVTLPSGTVTSAMIVDGTIVNADIDAAAEIAQSKISGLTSDLALKAPLASPTFTGTVTTGHLLPATDITFDLGSPAKMWRDIYVGPGSLYVNGQKVLQTDAGDVVITADANENLALRTSGSGNIELDPTGAGAVSIKGPMVIEAAANITSADGNGINFGSTINVDAISSKTLNTDLSLSGNGTGKVYLNDNAEVNGNLVIGGNLTVSGTTTTVNSETISLADNIIDLNSNFTTGSPTENAGVRIMRGDSNAVQIRWNESTDVWEFTTDGTTYNTLLSINDSGLTSALSAKLSSATAATTYAPLASPTFTGTNTVANITVSGTSNMSANGVQFSDGTQTKEGVPSRTTISQKTAGYTLAALNERDSMIEMNSASAITLTVPTNATVAYPVGTSIDILRVGAGAVDVAAAAGVTINATPGLKLRAQWSSATLIKRATDTWVLVGDLSA